MGTGILVQIWRPLHSKIQVNDLKFFESLDYLLSKSPEIRNIANLLMRSDFRLTYTSRRLRSARIHHYLSRKYSIMVQNGIIADVHLIDSLLETSSRGIFGLTSGSCHLFHKSRSVIREAWFQRRRKSILFTNVRIFDIGGGGCWSCPC